MPDIALDPATVANEYETLQIRQLTLTHFRNYEHLTLEAQTGPVVLFGANGAGKTTILEAVSLITPGKGMRGAALQDYARRGGNGPHPAHSWGVSANIRTENQDSMQISTGQNAPDSGRRTVKIDGKATGQSALAEACSCIWFLPSMVPSFVESMPVRRKFLDRLTYGFFPQHAAWVSRYEKLMRERNRLLEHPPWDTNWLDALEDGIAEAGVHVAQARVDALAVLSTARATVDGFPQAALRLEGMLEEEIQKTTLSLRESNTNSDLSVFKNRIQENAAFSGRIPQAEPRVISERCSASTDRGQSKINHFQQKLKTNRNRDAAAGRMLEGPHRSRLEIIYADTGLPMAQCSTGEQKALLLSILLSQLQAQSGQRSIAPVLLLDEVAANLDPDRREALFIHLKTLPVQSWLTGTEKALFSSLVNHAQCFTVAAGSATPVG